MRPLALAFRDSVLARDIPNCTTTLVDDHHIELRTSDALGQVNFYCLEDLPEIVELRISDLDSPDNPKFFLHFEMMDAERATELFDEMVDELSHSEEFEPTRVLLCCTTGMTTSLFASKLTDAATTLSLDYSFDVMPLEEAKAKGGDYAAVLLAPQVGYQREATAQAFPDAVVVQIPPKIFATYDAGATLQMVMHLLSDNTVLQLEDNEDLKLVRDLKQDKRIMVIAVVNSPRAGWAGWRVYDHGEIVAGGRVAKRRPNFQDVEDVIATLPVHDIDVSTLDAIGIAVPGVVNRGSISYIGREAYGDYELGRAISERYGVKVFVDNNANAAAVGCYVSQNDYDSVVLHTQQTGYLVGGQGIVVDGHLLKGRKNAAGELSPLYSALYGVEVQERDYGQAWTVEGMREIVAKVLAADCALIAPDVIYVAVDLLDDMDELRDEMAKCFAGNTTEFIPDLIRVTDYRERIALGELALCLQKLSHPRPHRKH